MKTMCSWKSSVIVLLWSFLILLGMTVKAEAVPYTVGYFSFAEGIPDDVGIPIPGTSYFEVDNFTGVSVGNPFVPDLISFLDGNLVVNFTDGQSSSYSLPAIGALEYYQTPYLSNADFISSAVLTARLSQTNFFDNGDMRFTNDLIVAQMLPGDSFYEIQLDAEPNLPAAVPEPSTLLLLGTGLVGVAGWGRFRKKRQ